jgi:hypothetical protein
MSLGFRYYEPLFAQVFSLLLDQYGILPVVAIGASIKIQTTWAHRVRSQAILA